jgi:hypothetical protein
MTEQLNNRVGLKTGLRKTGRANFDTFLDITCLLVELLHQIMGIVIFQNSSIWRRQKA